MYLSLGKIGLERQDALIARPLRDNLRLLDEGRIGKFQAERVGGESCQAVPLKDLDLAHHKQRWN